MTQTETQRQEEAAGLGWYICECGLKFKNDLWRQKDPKRQICAAGHAPQKMIWYRHLVDKLAQKYPFDGLDDLKGKQGGEKCNEH